jgi:hypothetical protein
VDIPEELARQKAELLAEWYPSQAGRDWFDDAAFLGLMRVRYAQSRVRYAEGCVSEKEILSPFGAQS